MLTRHACSVCPACVYVSAFQLEGMLSPFGELKDCVVIVEKMTQKSKVSLIKHLR